MMHMRLVVAAFLVAACHADTSPESSPPVQTPDVEVTSLFGDALRPPTLPDDVRADREAKLAEARGAHEAAPGDLEAAVWLGRRTAYLGRYRESIEIYDKALETHPDAPVLLRHRGHRYITTRRFNEAIADLGRAFALVDGQPDAVEEDGLPNPAGVPTGTLHTNIAYHLGLAHYLVGQFEDARGAFEACMKASTTDDMRVATSHWLYMTLRRLGRAEEAARVVAPIRADMELYENFSYHRLVLMYKGEVSPVDLIAADAGDTDRATLGYGLGNWYLVEGEPARAAQVWQAVLGTPQWAAFGYIAAEADLVRLQR